jgi:hypothetical protein
LPDGEHGVDSILGANVTRMPPNIAVANLAVAGHLKSPMGEFSMRRMRVAVVAALLGVGGPLTAGVAFATPTTGSISGVVLDSSGNPLEGACVGAYSTTGDTEIAYGYTASLADGSFVLSGVPTGSYDVQIDGCYDSQHIGRDIEPEYYKAGTVSGTQLSDYTVLTVTGGSSLTLDSQRTRPAADIDIRIQDSAGNVEPDVYPMIIPVAPVPSPLNVTGILKDMTSGGYWPITNLFGATYEIGYTYCGDPAPSGCRVGYIGYYSGFGLDGVPGQTTPVMTTAGQTTTIVDTVTVPPLLGTTTTLSTAPLSVPVGSTITLRAQVTASSGTHRPTGQVYFSDSADTNGVGLDPGVATVDANGLATYAWTAEAGSHTITASYGGDGGLSTSSGQIVIIDGQTQLPADGSSGATSTTTTAVAAGGSVSSAQPGVQPDVGNPLVVDVNSPTGGTVSIDTSPPNTAISHYRVLNVGATITAPTASAAAPLTLSFDVFDGALPAGSYASDLTVFRNGEPVDACTGLAGTASPDPCFASEITAGGSSTITVLSSHASTWDVESSEVGRIAGSDRIATAVAVSRDSFPNGNAGAVVLATATDYPDALVGAPLAAAVNAPLLLTSGTTVTDATLSEIARVLPVGGTVYLLGGPAAIPTSVSSELVAAGYQVVRYGFVKPVGGATCQRPRLSRRPRRRTGRRTRGRCRPPHGRACAHQHGVRLPGRRCDEGICGRRPCIAGRPECDRNRGGGSLRHGR